MSFVPVTGTATFRVADPPRDSVIEFSDDRRTVALAMRAALPYLTKAHSRDDLHPSVGLLSGAALLGMRLVAAGKFEPSDDARSWRMARLAPDDADRVTQLARARAHDDVPAEAAETVVRQVLDAVADAMPRAAPATSPAQATTATTGGSDFTERLKERIAARRREADQKSRDERDAGLPHLVRIALRVEADEEELVAGAVRLVVQVHDEQDPLHFCDARALWDPDAEHGFGSRARTHTTLAMRGAAEAWPALDRLLDFTVPDELTLETDDLVTLLDSGVRALAERGVEVLWPRSLGRDLQARAVLEPTSRNPKDLDLDKPLLGADSLFAFKWDLALDGDSLSAEEMDQLAAAASPILKLRGEWTIVDPDLARKAKKRLIRRVPASQAVAAALTGITEVPGAEPDADTGLPTDVPVVVGASLLDVRRRLMEALSREPIDPPETLTATLRGYQLQGFTWLTDLTGMGLGACLADDMGLGKTITVIALHLHRRQHQIAAPGAPTLVVCPASLLGNWEAEIARFAPGTPVRRFHGDRRELDDLGGGFVLTTYGTMRLDHERLATVPWDLVVADEAQHIKNPQAATARAIRKIESAARVALTGTPVENNLTELWAILDWAIPGLLGSRLAFRRAWAQPIEAGVDPAKTEQFAALIKPFLLRRRKADPGIAPELPAKTETDHLLSLTREQVVLYEAFVRDCLERIERADAQERRGLILKMLTGLKQICNHPAHFLKQDGAKLTGRSQKLDLLEEVLTTVIPEGGAVLVFTQYVAMARLLERALSRLDLDHQFLHGGTPVGQREEMVARFQAGEVPIFLLSLKAGGTGLNLTRADHVVHFDRWWNPAVEEQATDRAYRIGQTRPVQVHRVMMRGTVEEKVAQLIDRKRGLADAVLGNGEAALTELDDAELRDLVRLGPDPNRT